MGPRIGEATRGAFAYRAAAMGLMALCASSDPLLGQDIRGRVLEAGSERGVARALVQLIDTDDEVEALALSDSSGVYRLTTPGPGEYRLTAEAYGYDPLRSLLLSVGDRESYTVDVELAPVPLPIPGLRVRADRYEEIEDGLRLEIGIHPRSLRYEPVMRPEIEDHLDNAHGLTELVRWSNLASVVTRETRDGPCFQWRNRHCIPVYLNGMKVAQEMVPVLPLDGIEMIVIVTPGETIMYIGGAVLLYTPGWIR